MYEKLKFPSKMRVREKDQDERPRKGSLTLDQTPHKGSDVSRQSSLLFGRTSVKKTYNRADPQNLVAVLERLGEIEGILDKKQKNLKLNKFGTRQNY